MKRLLAIVLMCAVLLSVTGCTSGSYISCNADLWKSTDLMEGFESQPKHTILTLEFMGDSDYTDFSVRLLQECCTKGNILISPLSVMCALTMTANGAAGETREQIEQVFGGYIWEINTWLSEYTVREREEMKLANAIWFTEDDRFAVKSNFLQVNADYYGAGIFSAPFDDSTLKSINNWVRENTGGRIPEILDGMNPEAVMYLVNALAFEAAWETACSEHPLRTQPFMLEDGTVRRAEFMYCEEENYIESELAAGFVKYYEGRDYAFVGLLPREGLTMEAFVASLSGEALSAMWASVEDTPVAVAIPVFEAEYGADLAGTLADMGMTLAFDPENADFSFLGTFADGNISISRVIHKTWIRVDAQGTSAAAATVVEPTNAAAIPVEQKSVYLNRPFLYMIVDCETGIPIFIGIMMDPA